LGVLALGLVGALSLVWQQQATLASYVDTEHASASMTARTLTPIDPSTSADASKVSLAWDSPDSPWVTPSYVLSGSATNSGTNPVAVYSGTANSAVNDTSAAASTTGKLPFTEVAAGSTHACGVVRGQAYCWGTSTSGALGGASSPTNSPALVVGLAGKLVSDISAGTDRSCALADGDVYCWGTGVGASAAKVTGLSGTVTSISSGATQSCAAAGGDAYCWASGTAATAVSGALASRDVSSVSVGGTHACAVADGMAFCWGSNGSGQLGDGTTTTRTTPVLVATGEITGRTVSAVNAGGNRTCALAAGKAYCWGANGSGQIGDGSYTQRTTAVAVSGAVTGLSTISAGGAHTCALSSGTAYCWGAAQGNGSNSATNTPASVSSGTLSGRALTSIGVGTNFSCAAGDTPAACWGLGTSGQLGNAASVTSVGAVDANLSGPTCSEGAVRRSGSDCSLVQGTDYYYQLGYSIGSWTAPNSAWVQATTTVRPGRTPSATSGTATSLTLGWDAASEPGSSYGQYAVQRSASSSGSSPETIATTGATSWTDKGGFAQSRNFTDVASGTSHTCGILSGKLYCWGLNDRGQLGIGSTTSKWAPSLVSGLSAKTVTAVSAGGSHTCAVTSDSLLYCWGDNTSGQLGLGSTGGNQTSPQQAASSVTSVSAGTNHTCDVAGGSVYCWGANNNGQLGLSNTTTYNSAQKVVDTHSCAIDLFGWCIGQTAIFTNGSATAVAAGGSHSCVINGGSAYCWGLGTSGQLGDGTASTSHSAVKVSTGTMTNSSLTAITAGTSHTCAIRSGTAYCWGGDASGQLGNNATPANQSSPVTVAGLSSVTAVTAGGLHTCAIASTSAKAYCWGENANGQLGIGSTTDAPTPAGVTAVGALSGASVGAVSAGGSHSCLVSGGTVYCYGAGGNGRLGLGGSATDDAGSPAATYAEPRCAAEAKLLGDGTCSLSSGTTYYYRVTFTLDGRTSTHGSWVGATTNS